MSTVPADAPEPNGDADTQADAMRQKLRKDVASWSAARSDGSARQAADFSVPVTNPASPQPAKRAKRPAKPAPAAVDAAPAAKKPFGMSYDGVPQTDYIAYMIARGVR